MATAGALAAGFALACSASGSSVPPANGDGGTSNGASAGVGVSGSAGMGTSGSAGAGTSGNTGTSGNAGMGASGAAGAGTSGNTGTSGSAGVSGNTGTSGASGAGTSGASGSAGTSGGGPRFGTGGPFPFPQSKKPPYCSLTGVSGAATSAQAAYTFWKTTFVTSSGAGSALRVMDPQGGNRTVSEGIGYGMIAAAYMADRTTFDGLWTYAKAHLDANGLMNWQIDSNGNVSGQGSATDADEDIAWALIQASDQWSDTSYLDAAKTMIGVMKSKLIASDGMLIPGDGWGVTTTTYPDYFSPAYFRVFAQATGDMTWATTAIDRNYTILANVTGMYGLVPDSSSSTYAIYGNYGYDATRTPWRMAMDYCFNGEPRAKAYLDKIGAFFNGQGAVSTFGDAYNPATGAKASNNANMAFIGPAGVSGMAGFPTLLDNAFTYGATSNGGTVSYFAQSLRVLSMLMMSGNFIDYTKP